MELSVLPSGRLSVAQPESRSIDSANQDRVAAPNSALESIAVAFASSQAEGLFALAATRFDGSISPAMTYWRDFAAGYLSERCQTPELAEGEPPRIPPPTAAELAQKLLSVPPMRGAEYVSAAALVSLWEDLDGWVCRQIASYGNRLGDFLQERAPLWHQVGRVCFHLAENRRDPELPFAFLATYAPTVSGGSRVQYQPLSKALQEYAGARNKGALIKLLSPVNLSSQRSKVIEKLVESGDLYHPLAWTPQQAYRFLKDVPMYEESGILVRLPDWWKKRPRPRVGVRIGQNTQKRFDASSMLDFHMQFVLGEQQLTEEELHELLAADEDGLVLLKGQWVEVDRQRLAEALDHWKQVERLHGDGLSFIEGMRLLAGAPADLGAEENGEAAPVEWSFVEAGNWLGETLSKLRSPESLNSATSALSGLKAQLRPYQKTGVNWLAFLSELGLGACLADDMGLGKTIQVLALLLAQQKTRPHKPSLLVLPASLVANWKSEMNRFAPALRARFVHPSETPKEELASLAASPGTSLKDVDLVVTTYGMLLRQNWIQDVDWRCAVLDEAQAIKNPAARQTKAVKRLRADARIVLTGTPVENRLSDLWSLFDFVSPGLLGSETRFKKFIKTLESRQEDCYAPLRRLVQPYILRRMKTDKSIIADLPDKTEVRAYCGLSKRQAVLYAKLVTQLAEALENQEGIKRRGLVLSYLMQFKQLCNHPSQLLGDDRYNPEDGGKFQRLREICEELAERQERALVFTQFREMTGPLARFLSQVFGRNGMTLDGSTSVKKRKERIDEFQRDDGPPFFVLSLKAGGTGLNLTAASHVIHFDRWWNPAVENQATDRAFRIGQKRNVLVHKFVCRGTIEEKIDAMIEDKTQLAAGLLEGSTEKMLTEMSDEELLSLVSLDLDRASV